MYVIPFTYDPPSGCLTYRRAPYRSRIEAGHVAGRLGADGYLCLKIRGTYFKVHRIIWAIVTGADPNGQIDHIDGVGANNKWTNLRLASHTQNCFNQRLLPRNKSGFKGVSYCNTRRTWVAMITVSGVQMNLGRYADKETAARAYDVAATKHFGDFAFLNFPGIQ